MNNKKYVILKQHQITRDMIDASELSGAKINPMPILKDDDSQTGYYLVSVFDQYALEFKYFRKYTQEECEAEIVIIKAGLSPDNELHVVQKVQNTPSGVRTSLRLEGDYFTAAPNTTTTHWHKIGGVLDIDYQLRGAEVQFVSAKAGDWVEVYVTDKDNVLGLGENVRLKPFAPKFYCFEHNTASAAPPIDLVDDDTSDLINKNLYIEIVYKNNQPAIGGNTVSCVINFWKYAEE